MAGVLRRLATFEQGEDCVLGLDQGAEQFRQRTLLIADRQYGHVVMQLVHALAAQVRRRSAEGEVSGASGCHLEDLPISWLDWLRAHQ